MDGRTAKSIKNIQVTLFYYIVQTLLGFWSRKVFFDYLGSEVLGLDTTASNLLSFLNLAEMGTGTAVAFFLYKPLYNKDIVSINEIVTLQGWIYKRVAIFIIIGASILMLFFPFIFNNIKIPLWYAYATFLVMLFSSLLGYFYNYRQIVLGADQKIYKVTRVTQGVGVLSKVILILLLPIVAYPFIFYLFVNIVISIFGCLWLNYILKKEYPWLEKTRKAGTTLIKAYPEILKKTKQLFVHEISSVILFRLSPLIMYAYSSLTIVALYGNYLIIVTQLSRIISMAFSSTGAAVGNLIASGDKERIISVFWELFDSRLIISAIMLMCTFFFAHPFITLWLGKDYLLTQIFLCLMLIDASIGLVRITVDNYIKGFGLFSDIWAPMAEGVINFSSAIVFGYYFGYKGVIMGSILSQALIIGIWKPYFLFSKGLNISPYLYFKPVIMRILVLFANILGFNYLFSLIIPCEISNFGVLIKYLVVAFFVISSVVYSEFLLFSQGTRNFTVRIYKVLKHQY